MEKPGELCSGAAMLRELAALVQRARHTDPAQKGGFHNHLSTPRLRASRWHYPEPSSPAHASLGALIGPL